MREFRYQLGSLIKTFLVPQREAPSPGRQEERSRTATSFSDADIETVRPLFDVDFYLRQNPDVASAGQDAIVHYLMWGWQELRDPSPEFSTSYYLSAHPDIAANKLNPLVHYAIAGRKEGRRPKADGALPLAYSVDALPSNRALFAISSLDPSPSAGSPPLSSDARSLDIHWVIPDFSRGGGGHMTIFRMIHILESFGHRCTIWIFMANIHRDAGEAYDDIVKYFQCVGAQVRITNDGNIDASGDAIIATGWDTTYPVAAARNFREKFYFVQDHEPEFYPTGAESLLAKESYNFDLSCICAGAWLEKLMKERYGRWARSFQLAYDHEVYQPSKDSREGNTKLKIAVYSREATSRRCVQLSLTALHMLGNQRDDFEVHFFGQERLPFNEVNYPAWNHGVLNATELANLYRDCDLGICFSATNYSLVPQEMMACGLPVLELDVESTRAIFPTGVVSLAGPNPADLVSKIAQLLDSSEMRLRQAEAARVWVEDMTWEQAAKSVENAILERLSLTRAAPASAEPPSMLDVVIPTYNGMGEIERVIGALRTQTHYSRMAIYCIDSSSSDGTTEWLRAQSDISTIVIPKSEFQHGRTRNVGASAGRSPYIAFLTQDAVPASMYWANDIIQMMQHFPDAAGIFGRHLPYESHPQHIRDEIVAHFDSMLKFPLSLSKFTDPVKWDSGDTGWRQLLHFYSDNNSCMRREIWNEFPYPEVEFGEDQIWANAIIEAGYSKIYAPTATVFHSHDFSPSETYARAEIESRFFYQFFGYKLAPDSEADMWKAVENEQLAFHKSPSYYTLSIEERKHRDALIHERMRGWFDGLNAAKRSSG